MQKRFIFILFVLICNCLVVFATATETPEKYFEKAYVHFWHQDYDSALYDFQKFIETENQQAEPRKSKIASMHRYRGHCFEALQLFDFAITENQKAWQMYVEINDSANVSVTLQKLADLFYQQGKPAQALFFINQAIPYFEKLKWISKLEMAYFLLGEIYYELGDLEQSKSNFYKNLQISTLYNSISEKTYLYGKVCFYLAKINTLKKQQNKVDSLLNLAENDFKINASQLPQFYTHLIELWLFKAANCTQQMEAREFISQAEKILSQAKEMKLYIELAWLNFEFRFNGNNNIESKFTDFEKNFRNKEITKNMQQDFYVLYSDFLQQQFEKQGDLQFLKKKLDVLEKQFFQSENSVGNYSILNDFAFSGHKSKVLFDVAVKTSVLLFERTNDKNYLNKAFLFAEYFSFNEMVKNRSNSGQNLQREKQIEVANLQFKINELIAEIENGQTQKQEELVLLINQFENLQRNVSPDFEDNFFRNYKNLLSKLTLTLDANEMYLKFYETDSLLFQFCISLENIELKTIKKSDEFLSDVEMVRSFISEPPGQVTLPDVQKYVSSAFRLNCILVPENEQNTIVVDWPLHQMRLPFEVLITRPDKLANLNMSQLSFLIKEKEVRYSGSCVLYLSETEENNTNTKRNYAGFAPFAETSKRVKNRLNFSGNEIKKISKRLNGKEFLGEKASKKALLETANEVKIVQLSTHANINMKYPQLSEIQFLQAEANPTNRLFFYEIVEHNWNNDLVILSACNTGVGEHFANYGTVSLANAFQLGGAQSVIGANWLASDFVSSEILTQTMQNIADGMPIGRALQKSKIDFLQWSDDLFSHPFYWAVYSYQGAAKELLLTPHKTLKIWWIVFPLSFLFLLYFLQKFVRSRKIN